MPFSRLDRALVSAARAHRRAAAAALAPLGLHPGQEVLLLALRRSTGATQAQLARILQVEPPTLAVMVRRLEAAGFVARSTDPADARVKVVALTDAGRDAAALADAALTRLSRVSADALGVDSDAASDLLERLAAALQATAEPAL